MELFKLDYLALFYRRHNKPPSAKSIFRYLLLHDNDENLVDITLQIYKYIKNPLKPLRTIFYLIYHLLTIVLKPSTQKEEKALEKDG